jgi:hypothetical protein
VGAEIVERGREAFDADLVIRFAAKAVVGLQFSSFVAARNRRYGQSG